MQGTQALLELKAGLENMASKGNIKVILVQYKAIKKSKVKELKQAKAVLNVIKWKGEKSKFPKGRFWKQLQVEMPVKKISRSLSLDGLMHSPEKCLTQSENKPIHTTKIHKLGQGVGRNSGFFP